VLGGNPEDRVAALAPIPVVEIECSVDARELGMKGTRGLGGANAGATKARQRSLVRRSGPCRCEGRPCERDRDDGTPARCRNEGIFNRPRGECVRLQIDMPSVLQRR